MVDKRIDIQIGDKVSGTIAPKIRTIATSSERAHKAISKLKMELNNVNATALNKLANAYAKMTNAMARQTAAKAKLTVANMKLAESNRKVALTEQKILTEMGRTQTQAARTAAVQQAANDKTAQSNAKVALTQQKVTTETKRTSKAADLAKQSQARLSNEVKKGALITQNAANAAARHGGILIDNVAKMNRATAASARLTQAKKRLSRSTGRASRSLGSLSSKLFIFSGLAVSGTGLVRFIDKFTNLENKLKNVTDNAAQLAVVTDEVFAIARRTRTSVEDTAKAFQRFDLALKQLGASQRESLLVTETINKALVLSGANVGEQSAALLQLSQAFNKGKLDGDEFRTVMELLPPVADAIAKELGRGREELLELAPQGVITSEVMRKALVNASEDIATSFDKTTSTVSQSFVVLGDSFTKALGEFEKKTRVFATIAQGILLIADNIELVTASLTSLPAGAFTFLKDEVKLTEDGVVSLGDAMVATSDIISEEASIAATAFEMGWSEAFGEVSLGANSLGDVFDSVLDYIIKITKGFMNQNIKAWLVGYHIIIGVWEQFTPAYVSIVSSAFNQVMSIIETGTNAILPAIEAPLRLLDKIRVKFKKEPLLGPDPLRVDLSKFKRDVKPLEFELENVLKNAVGKVAGRDFVGEITGAVINRSRRNIQQRPGAGRDPLRPETDPPSRSRGADEISRSREMTTYQEKLGELYDQNRGRLRDIALEVAAVNMAKATGTITDEQYINNLVKLNTELQKTQLAMGKGGLNEVFTVGLGQLVENYEGALSGLSDSFGNFFQNVTDGFADSIGRAIVMGEDLEEALKRVAQNALAELISSLIKLGIQYAVNAALAKTAVATTTAFSVGAAGVVSTAWAVPAALVSLASFGSNMLPAMTSIATTVGLSKAFSIAGMMGFEQGGYTGNIGRSEVAGVVHGREFVMNADATARNRGVLEAMNRGQSASSMSGMGTQINVTVENYGSSEISVEQVSATDVRIIARDVASQTIKEEGPGVIAGDISNANGRVSKSLAANTNVTRKR